MSMATVRQAQTYSAIMGLTSLLEDLARGLVKETPIEVYPLKIRVSKEIKTLSDALSILAGEAGGFDDI